MKTQNEIRKSFLDFFSSKGHRIVPSSSVVPNDDPTLLFANAGMNQFKPYFLGSSKPEFTRAADTQKCLRVSGKHNDLDEVGRDTYHHTFFEMLGNWSFGDYFKEDAIKYAWEFLTDICGLEKSKLYATYFGGDSADGTQPDEEAASLWKSVTDIDPSHVMPFGRKENFWEMGETGPCGPCSEIHIDLGPEKCDMKDVPGHVCGVNGDCSRFMEIWNLVFMQFNRSKDRSLARLDKNHVDTGMGFERLTAILQGKNSNYDTDLFTPLLSRISEISGFKYGAGDESDVAMRVCADHIKALCFAIADGAKPDKKGRGSVLRSLLRRASRFGMQTLGMKEPFLYKLVPSVSELYSGIFPEIRANEEKISSIVIEEEKLFGKTLEQGLERFNELAASTNGGVLDGFEAYRLYHQDGFPKDLILQMASERGMSIDEEGWAKAEQEHRERSKGEMKEAVLDPQLIADLPATEFCGYWESGKAENEGTVLEAKILRMPSDSVVVLDRTPFYAQSGGQIGDSGVIEGDGFRFTVADTVKTGDYVLHCGFLEEGDPDVLPSSVKASVDFARRKALQSAHTATHMLQWALRTVLGPHVNQKGSEVNPDSLRFDFTHPKQMTADEISKVEELVNGRILENQALSISWKDLEQARAEGITALFGEKYGKTVRAVEIGGWSRELCGGTHCMRTGDIGSFRIVSESSSEAGVRRIEALTGRQALRAYAADRAVIKDLCAMAAARPEELVKRIESMNAQIKELKKQHEAEVRKNLASYAEELFTNAEKVGSVSVVKGFFNDLDNDALGTIADAIRSRQSVCGMLVSVCDGNVCVAGFASKDMAGKDKVNSGNIVRECCKMLGGGGGGRFDFAKGGGKDASLAGKALEESYEKMKAAVSAL